MIPNFSGFDTVTNSLRVADHVLFFEVIALFAPWKFPLEFHASSGCVVAENLLNLVKSMLDFCQDVGFEVMLIGSDQGKPNQKLFKLLGVTIETPYFHHGKSDFCKIFVIKFKILILI